MLSLVSPPSCRHLLEACLRIFLSSYACGECARIRNSFLVREFVLESLEAPAAAELRLGRRVATSSAVPVLALERYVATPVAFASVLRWHD
jgi:hypothetical protein